MTILVEQIVDQIIALTDFEEMDRPYLINRLLAIVGPENRLTQGDLDFYQAKEKLMDEAQETGWIQPGQTARQIAASQIMDLLTPSPSKLNRHFWQAHQKDPQAALKEYYEASLFNENIKERDIAKNIKFQSESVYGPLDITINLSKPEKDPKDILAQKSQVGDYPSCPICLENEGYLGDPVHAARSQHRLIRFPLMDEDWGFHYSPYAYYQEHAIFLNLDHQPMAINKKTFIRLLEILDLFPGYFVGSNAGLPIVGGSILGHDHYQGGRYNFPMERARHLASYSHPNFPQVSFEELQWPLAFLRLKSSDKDQLIQAANHILETWLDYSDPSIQIKAYSESGSHHSLTPIARKKGQDYELDLVFRDNQTSPQFPDGIFHPHPDVQHIKKENIGLIEVMGLAILPPRLKGELEEVATYLCGKGELLDSPHKAWAERILAANGLQTEDQVEALLQEEVGKVFCRVLEDAGVFKGDAAGRAAFKRFLDKLGLS